METSSPEFSQRLAQRRGDYGFDAPYVPALFLLIGLALLVIGFLSLLLWQFRIFGIIDLLVGLYMLLSGASYIYTTRRGKFQVWAERAKKPVWRKGAWGEPLMPLIHMA